MICHWLATSSASFARLSHGLSGDDCPSIRAENGEEKFRPETKPNLDRKLDQRSPRMLLQTGASDRLFSSGINRRVFCQDSLQSVAPPLAAKARAGVRAQSINLISFSNLVPEYFETNGCLRLTLLPQ